LDSGDGLRLNEWLAAGGGTNDFVEIYNPAPLPVSLDRWVLTDDPTISGSTNNRIAALTFIDAGGFARFHTDGTAGGAVRTSFQLDQFGETIRLLNPEARIIDTIDFLLQVDSSSEGRYPDGAERIVRFSGSSSPGAPNYLLLGDADNDSMDDLWEMQNGFDPASPNDAHLDADQDGMSNLQEFFSGTNPRDASSLLDVQLDGLSAGSPTIRFTAQTERSYRIEYSDTLSPAVWNVLADVPSEGAARNIAVTDPTSLQERPTRFYRVVIIR
jgi:hypothetical protein